MSFGMDSDRKNKSDVLETSLRQSAESQFNRFRRSSWLRSLTRLFGFDDKLFGLSANQYLISLRSTFHSIENTEEAKKNPEILTEIDRILTKYTDGVRISDDQSAWDDARKCERLFVNLYDPTRLGVELDRRILEAQNTKLDFAAFYVGRQQRPSAADTQLTDAQIATNRALLSRLIEDQQWHDMKLYLKRGYAHTAQSRVSVTFLIALAIFGTTMWIVFETKASVVLKKDPRNPPSNASTTQQ